MSGIQIDMDLVHKAMEVVKVLCNDIGDRSVGSEGNRQATRYVSDQFTSLRWAVDSQKFDAIDWIDGGADLECGGKRFESLVSPYSTGCDVSAPLVHASTTDELSNSRAAGAILLLSGEIASEQLMPKSFVFYNPPEHQKIIKLLETAQPAAIICATGRNPSLAGGVYPFPLIEDGDFDIPSVYMTEEEGRRLISCTGETCTLRSNSTRVPGTGENVTATNRRAGKRIAVTAHIDAKKGTPGAIDNATGVAVLIILAELLADFNGELGVELVALNGEDYFSVPGQMAYIASREDSFDEIVLNINIDGAGYHHGDTALSFYNLPPAVSAAAAEVIKHYPGIIEGCQWPQGDHSIFIQYGCPAIAASSKWFTENIDSQEITHTPEDNIGIVDCMKIAELSSALDTLIRNIAAG